MTTGSSTPFSAYTEKDSVNPSITLQYQSISAMPQYRSASFEVSCIVRDLSESHPTDVAARNSASKITSKVGRLQGPLVKRLLGLLHNLPQVCSASLQHNLPHNPPPPGPRSVVLVTPALRRREQPDLAHLAGVILGRQAQGLASLVVVVVPLDSKINRSSPSRIQALVRSVVLRTHSSQLVACSEVEEHLVPTISPNRRLVCAFAVIPRLTLTAFRHRHGYHLWLNWNWCLRYRAESDEPHGWSVRCPATAADDGRFRWRLW